MGSRFVYAWVFWITLLLVLALTAVCAWNPSLYPVWNIPLEKAALQPPFADLRALLEGLDFYQQRGSFDWDQLAKQGLIFNYPPVWVLFSHLGIKHRDFISLGITLAACFLALVGIMIRPSTAFQALCAIAIVLSPAFLLAVERGNSDLIVFLMIAGSLVLVSRYGTLHGAYLIVPAVLKLFPVFAMVGLLRQPLRSLRFVVPFLVSILALYAVVSWGDLHKVSTRTPRPRFLSYGVSVPAMLVTSVPAVISKSRNLPPEQGTRDFMSVAYPFAVGVSYIVMLGVCGYYFRKGLISDTFIVEGWRGDFFLAGAGLYVGTYFLGANWIYRLVFLIFLVPQLFVWLEEACPQKTLAVWTLTLITVCFWSMCINDSPWAMLPKQALFISLCGLLAYLAGVALPQRLRNGVS